MNTQIELAGEVLTPLPSGALWWADCQLLVVGDLHLGRSERTAREGGALLPPYESIHTLNRLETEIARTHPRTVVLLGDTFDDLQSARALAEDVLERLRRIAAGRRMIWIAGNHDPGPVELPGAHLAELTEGPLTFRHIAEPSGSAEISGHYHPKARLRLKGQYISRPCFLADTQRVILPAFGTYTGGLDITSPVFSGLFNAGGTAYLTGLRIHALPLRNPA